MKRKKTQKRKLRRFRSIILTLLVLLGGLSTQALGSQAAVIGIGDDYHFYLIIMPFCSDMEVELSYEGNGIWQGTGDLTVDFHHYYDESGNMNDIISEVDEAWRWGGVLDDLLSKLEGLEVNPDCDLELAATFYPRDYYDYFAHWELIWSDNQGPGDKTITVRATRREGLDPWLPPMKVLVADVFVSVRLLNPIPNSWPSEGGVSTFYDLCAFPVTVDITDTGVPVYFADTNLKVAVEEKLGISDPTPTDMLALSSLHAHNRDIVDLTGLEYATNLSDLQLPHNQISDISALGGLTNLTELDLWNNQISDISAVAGLTNLTDLWLGWNQISDISALAGLTNLTWLNLGGNQISDISAVVGLTNLTELYLSRNA